MKPKSVPSALLAKVRDEDIARFKQDYYEANFVLDIIKEAIEKKLEILSDKEEDISNFSDPGYVAKYTHMLGQKKMAKELLQLFPTKG